MEQAKKNDEKEIAVPSRMMPNEIRDRLKYVMKNVTDNWQTYGLSPLEVNAFDVMHEYVIRGGSLTAGHVSICERVFNLYYKNDRVSSRLRAWWNIEASKNVLGGLGT